MKDSVLPEKGIYFRTNDFKKDRQTLVFIHGLSGSLSAWWPYEKSFQDNYNILTFDLRGHGKSGKPIHYNDYEINKQSEDLHYLLKFLNIDSCILVSHSFGTLLALKFITEHPQMVEAMVLLSPTYGVNNNKTAKILKYPLKLLASLINMRKVQLSAGGHIDYSQFQNLWDFHPRANFYNIKNTSLRVNIFCLVHIYSSKLDSLWKDIKVPVLAIHGKRDRVIPLSDALQIRREIPECDFEILNKADHVFPLRHSRETTEILNNFLRKLPELNNAK